MAKKAKHVSKKNEPEEYELLPHKEIEELKEELHKLKEFEITPTKKLRVSLVELNQKLDKLLKIFDEARHEIRSEEIGLGFKEKMKPIIEKMDKLLEQQADIAEGMVALADIVKEKKKAPAPSFNRPGLNIQHHSPPETRSMPPRPAAPGTMPPRPTAPIPGPGNLPPRPPAKPSAQRVPPAPPRKKRFGII